MIFVIYGSETCLEEREFNDRFYADCVVSKFGASLNRGLVVRVQEKQ